MPPRTIMDPGGESNTSSAGGRQRTSACKQQQQQQRSPALIQGFCSGAAVLSIHLLLRARRSAFATPISATSSHQDFEDLASPDNSISRDEAQSKPLDNQPREVGETRAPRSRRSERSRGIAAASLLFCLLLEAHSLHKAAAGRYRLSNNATTANCQSPSPHSQSQDPAFPSASVALDSSIEVKI